MFGITDKLMGSRVLEGRWGVERMAIAVPKGRDAAKMYLERFVREVTADGSVALVAERAGLLGIASE